MITSFARPMYVTMLAYDIDHMLRENENLRQFADEFRDTPGFILSHLYTKANPGAEKDPINEPIFKAVAMSVDCYYLIDRFGFTLQIPTERVKVLRANTLSEFQIRIKEEYLDAWC